MDKILAEAFGQEGAHLATEEKQRLLSRLLGRLAHEIRNPLSSLDVHVQLLEEDVAQLDPAVRDPMAARLEIMHGELHRLENIVKHFLRLSRPSDLDPAPVNLGELIGHVCDLMRPEAAAREIELVACVDEPLPLALADGAQLTQALLNLVINGLQAVPRGGRIEVAAYRQPGSSSVWIEVRDTGPGIPSDKLMAIFEPYYTTKEEGSGLGLWISQQIATAHGGLLQAANRPHGGAVFTLQLPAGEKAVGGG